MQPRSRLVTAIVALFLLFAAACGSDDDGSSASTSDTTSSSTDQQEADTGGEDDPSDSDVAEPEPEPADAEEADPDADTEALESDAAAAEPLRIVDLSDATFELVALGIAPVGNFYGPEALEASFVDIDADPEVIAATVRGASVAPAFEVDIETVLSLEPDIVLTTDGFAPFFADALSLLEEAGVEVVTVSSQGTWQERTRAIATAAGAAAAADDRIATIEADLAALAADIDAADLTGTVVSVIRPSPDGSGTYVFVPPSQVATVLAELGLTQPEAQLTSPSDPAFPATAAQTLISDELLGAHDGDQILYGEVFPGQLDAFIEAPAAQTLAAVTAGRIGGYPYLVWALPSAVGVEQMLEDIRANLLP